MTATTIRQMTPADLDTVHTIGADTAYYGDPVERVFDDRRLFIDLFMRPYTKHFAATSWVAEQNGTVTGFLIGCVDTAAFMPLYQQALRQGTIRLLTLRYRLGWRTLRAMLGFLREQFISAPPLNLTTYPAHLHINLSASYRGQGTGRRLMETYLDHCRAAGIPGVFLTTSSKNEIALHLYEKMGFRVLYRHRSPYHSMICGQPVDAIRMGLNLTPPRPRLDGLLADVTPENIHDETDWGDASGNE